MNEKEDQGNDVVDEGNEKDNETLKKKLPPILPFR